MDYYPGGKDCGELEKGRSFYCEGSAGVSLLEITLDEPDRIYMKVWTASRCSKPYTADKLKRAAFFTMDEDWRLEAQGEQTTLTRYWLNINKGKMRFLPMAWLIRKTVKKESQLIIEKWERLAKQSA